MNCVACDERGHVRRVRAIHFQREGAAAVLAKGAVLLRRVEPRNSLPRHCCPVVPGHHIVVHGHARTAEVEDWVRLRPKDGTIEEGQVAHLSGLAS
eukprot:5078425-Prymnesium_polylepis.2